MLFAIYDKDSLKDWPQTGQIGERRMLALLPCPTLVCAQASLATRAVGDGCLISGFS